MQHAVLPGGSEVPHALLDIRQQRRDRLGRRNRFYFVLCRPIAERRANILRNESFQHRLTCPVQARSGLTAEQEHLGARLVKASAQALVCRELQAVQLHAQQPFQQQLGRAAAADIHQDIPRPHTHLAQVGGHGLGVFRGGQFLQKDIQFCGVQSFQVKFLYSQFRQANCTAVGGDLRPGQALPWQCRPHTGIITRRQKRRGQAAAGDPQIFGLFVRVQCGVYCAHQVHIPREEIEFRVRVHGTAFMQPAAVGRSQRPQHRNAQRLPRRFAQL